MTDEELEQLRALLSAEEVSARPWSHRSGSWDTIEPADDQVMPVGEVYGDADRALIVAAVNALPGLLAKVDELRQENRDLEAQLMARAFCDPD